MRAGALILFAMLLGCSSTTVTPPTVDTGTADVPTADAPTVDAPTVDAPTVDAPTVDVPTVDVPTVDTPMVDVPTVDTSVMDVVDVPDVPADRPVPDVAPMDVTAVDVSCASGQIRCGGVCTSVASDPSHCGACGNVCRAGAPCVGGSCLPCGGCAAGNTCCGSACIDLSTDVQNCGACGSVCPTGRPCLRGTCIADDCPGGQFCSGVCVRTTVDSANCGGCGQRCCAGNVCSAGACTVACAPGMASCPGPMSSCRGSVCANLVTDPMNCGRCGAQCLAGETCVSGVCRGSAFMALAPCAAASDYASTASTVRFGGAVGAAYDPPCVTVRAGGSITWEGTFSGHPLSPSSRGSTGSPIARVGSGTSATARFPTVGFYPFYCEFHGSDSGSGMSGVVRVIE